MIIVGGIIHIGVGVFHLFFDKLYSYDTEVKSLSFLNQRIAIMINQCIAYLFCGIGFITIWCHTEFVSTELGENLSLMIASFWVFRAYLQLKYFKLKKSLFALCLISSLILCYLLPIL